MQKRLPGKSDGDNYPSPEDESLWQQSAITPPPDPIEGFQPPLGITRKPLISDNAALNLRPTRNYPIPEDESLWQQSAITPPPDPIEGFQPPLGITRKPLISDNAALNLRKRLESPTQPLSTELQDDWDIPNPGLGSKGQGSDYQPTTA